MIRLTWLRLRFAILVGLGGPCISYRSRNVSQYPDDCVPSNAGSVGCCLKRSRYGQP
jgi:hypothetical protein